MYINGKKVSDDRYVPAWLDYEPRVGRRINYPIHDTFTHRVYYLEYTLDSYIANGENAVEVILGNGWYNQHERLTEGDLWYGSPKLWYEIVSGGKTIAVSDENAVWKQSVIVRNNIYSGETHDFRLKDCDSWKKVSVCDGPKGEMCPQDCPVDKLIRVITPELVGSTRGCSVRIFLSACCLKTVFMIPHINCLRLRTKTHSAIFFSARLRFVKTGKANSRLIIPCSALR